MRDADFFGNDDVLYLMEDMATGEIRLAQIFVAVLGASGYTFAEATMSQKLPAEKLTTSTPCCG